MNDLVYVRLLLLVVRFSRACAEGMRHLPSFIVPWGSSEGKAEDV